MTHSLCTDLVALGSEYSVEVLQVVRASDEFTFSTLIGGLFRLHPHVPLSRHFSSVCASLPWRGLPGRCHRPQVTSGS